MNINISNADLINSEKVYVHDDVLGLLQFDRINKELRLSVTKNWPNKKTYSIVFLNVLGFEMTSCDFWGMSECILDFQYIEHSRSTLLPKLIKKVEDSQNYMGENNNIEPKYFETIITFGSGDELIIASETVVID